MIKSDCEKFANFLVPVWNLITEFIHLFENS
jgi:hypothetical protein